MNAEAGFTLGLADALDAHTSPLTIPSSAPSGNGTVFSYYIQLALEVTVAAATNILNRKIKQASNPATGLFYFWKAAASYVQPSSGNKPADSGSNGNTPAGYTAMSTTAASYDNAYVSANSTGRNGGFALLVGACDGTYAGGAGSATAMPNIQILYDEQ